MNKEEFTEKYGNPVLPQIISPREENELIEAAINTLINFLFYNKTDVNQAFVEKVRDRLYQHLSLKYGPFPEKFNEFLSHVKAGGNKVE